jgi:formate-dependent phosphoribosylglycinamide formyltransferase (GAR transformylase)
VPTAAAVVATAATAVDGDVKELGRRIVYSGPVLFDLTITFLVVRSFTDKSNGSNSIEHQLSVVKRRTESKL